MVSNIILSEIESFNKVFLKVMDQLFDHDMLKVMSTVLISPGTREFFLQMHLEEMENLSQMALSEDFRKYRHITLSEHILLCPLKDRDKVYPGDFEFVLAVYNHDDQLSGLIYGAVAKSDQERLIAGLMDDSLMLLCEHTIMLLCNKYAAYNRLFYTVIITWKYYQARTRICHFIRRM